MNNDYASMPQVHYYKVLQVNERRNRFREKQRKRRGYQTGI